MSNLKNNPSFQDDLARTSLIAFVNALHPSNGAKKPILKIIGLIETNTLTYYYMASITSPFYFMSIANDHKQWKSACEALRKHIKNLEQLDCPQEVIVILKRFVKKVTDRYSPNSLFSPGRKVGC
ncbi:MAG: hypothetical protein FWE01_01140 [Firmicutes bacterium]|nr:hypothetical protein [Bacillota bacterium]